MIKAVEHVTTYTSLPGIPKDSASALPHHNRVNNHLNRPFEARLSEHKHKLGDFFTSQSTGIHGLDALLHCGATPWQHRLTIQSHRNTKLLRRSGIPYLEWRAVRGLGRHGPWREVTNQLQKDTIGVNRVNNATGIGISARTTRRDL